MPKVRVLSQEMGKKAIQNTEGKQLFYSFPSKQNLCIYLNKY